MSMPERAYYKNFKTRLVGGVLLVGLVAAATGVIGQAHAQEAGIRFTAARSPQLAKIFQ